MVCTSWEPDMYYFINYHLDTRITCVSYCTRFLRVGRFIGECKELLHQGALAVAAFSPL